MSQTGINLANGSGTNGAPRRVEPLACQREPVAIVGIGCRFPGNANGPQAFWQLLAQGVDAIREVPADRWDIPTFYDPRAGAPGKTNARWGGFIDAIDQFDAPFFGIAPREAARMDPQQRLLLEVAWEALEDGGLPLERVAGRPVAVYVGVSSYEYALIQNDNRDYSEVDTYTNTGSAQSIVANRISYCFNLRGPSLAIDTACSSALVAVHLACESLWKGEATLGLAGGVNVLIWPGGYIGFSRLSMLSPDGRCKAFDASANGFVRSEGAGVVVLKPLARAIADGDRVYALIRATGVNQDGRTGGMTVPSQSAQEDLLRQTCHQAGLEPGQIQYAEAHGTGTLVGDPIEARALGNVLSAGRPAADRCLVGSVKTNIGHLEPASGIAGLIKVALALQHRQIPANLHLREPNPEIPFEALQLRVPVRLEPFPHGPDHGPALATINSFGFGGTNANAVLEEFRMPTRRSDGDPKRERGVAESVPDTFSPQLIPLSARSPEALRALAGSCQDFVSCQANGSSFRDVVYASAVRRTHHDHRLALVARTREELAAQLQAFAAGEMPAGASSGRATPGQRPSVAFVFSGQGPQWWAMGRQLIAQEPVFHDMIRRCDALLSRLASWSLWDELHADEPQSRLHETAIAQPALFAIQVALAALWQSWGIEPDALIGHSVGEVAAAHVAGALSLEDAARVIFERGRCMELAPARGRMLAVGLSLEAVQPLLAGYGDRVAVAAINSPRSLTLSGEGSALEEVGHELERQQAFQRFVPVQYAFHSAQMDPIRDELLQSLTDIRPQTAKLLLVSTVTGRQAVGPELDAHYWWQNVRQSVQFADGIDRLIEGNHSIFLEVGPHPVLSTSISECLAQRGHKGSVLASLRRKEDERATMLRALGSLYIANHPICWETVAPSGQFSGLPSYPWQHESHWHELDDSRELRLATARHPLLGRALRTPLPTWEAAFDRSRLAYLEDHQVLGRPVVPATAYLEMALAAGHELFPSAPAFALENVKLDKACFLGEGAAPTVQTVFNPDGATFQIYTRPLASSGGWTAHVGGVLRARPEPGEAATIRLEELQQQCARELPVAESYTRFKDLGLIYGPAFQGIRRLWQGDGQALAEVQAPDAVKGYHFHPAALDACIQVIFGTLPTTADRKFSGVYLPVEIAEVRIHGVPTARLWSHAQLVERTPQSVTAHVRVFDDGGRLVWEARGLRCQAVGADSGSTETADDLLYAFQWQPCPRAGHETAERRAGYLVAPSELVGHVQVEAMRRLDGVGAQERDQRYNAALDQLCRAYILQGLGELGLDLNAAGRTFTTAELADRLGVIERHRRLLGRFLEILTEDGDLRRQADGWELTRPATFADPLQTWKQALADHPASYPDLMLLHRCGQALAPTLRGQQDPLQLVFPEGSLTTSEHFYQDAPFLCFGNLAARDAVRAALARLPEGRRVRVLEIGAGTGGLTAHVLPVLPAGRAEYVFTDLSNHFFNKAEQKFSDYPFIQYQRLDIESPPADQGFAGHSFDLVLAAQMLHATADLRQSLRHIHQLLAADGMLVLVESVVRFRWIDVVFGLLEGWWRFTDRDLRPDHALLDFPRWRQVLQQTGFSDVCDAAGDAGLGKAVILGRAQGSSRSGEPSQTEPLPEAAGRWLLFADRSGVAEEVARRLEAQGASCALVIAGSGYQQLGNDRFEISPASHEQMRQVLDTVFEPGHASSYDVAHFWNLDAPTEPTTAALNDAQAASCLSIVHLLQTWSQVRSMPADGRTPRLTLVTSQAQAVAGAGPSAPGQAPVWGLARVLANEFPQVRCRRIDLGLADRTAELEALVEEIRAPDAEDEIALRGEARYIHRYVHSSLDSLDNTKTASAGQDRSFQLEISRLGTLDGLVPRARQRSTPPAGAVEIEVAAAGLNFSDVMKALGLYPGLGDGPVPLGIECSGTIRAIGADVTGFQIGDRVLAVAPFSFGSHVTIDQHLVAPMPRRLNFEEAATIPIAFLTAYHALHYLGRMSRGERVLIHSATGGVGLAAVQLAQQAGTEVFATAGTAEKRELLRALGIKHVFDSRSLTFADQVLEATDGVGVDIILNSLSGEAIPKGLAVLADHGRFLEIGKRDIYGNSKVGLLPFRKNLSFIAIDLDRALRQRRSDIGQQFRDVVRLVDEGRLAPLPYRVFPMARVSTAFRAMAQAKHIGKLVISLQDAGQPVVPVAAPADDDQQASFVADASYLISGGLGGFGLAVAKWLVDNGARHLVLVGRRGMASDEARTAVAELETLGAQVAVEQADVAQAGQLAAVLGRIRDRMPPLRGVVHAAMVLDDCLMLNLNRDRFYRVLEPKMAGAWNLHCQTRGLPLDFFVLFSSMSAVFGQGGQANYAAANAFLDALAHHRRGLGLPGLTINWGSLADVGYVARNSRVAEQFEAQGIRHLTAREALTLLGALLRRQAVEAGIMRVNWTQWKRVLADMAAVAPRFALLAQESAGDDDALPEQTGVSLRKTVLDADPAQRRDLLVGLLRDKVAHVLGTAAAKLDVDKPLTDIGLDSLMAVELRNWIEGELRINLPIVELMHGPSVTQVADLLVQHLGKEQGTATVAVTGVPPAPPPPPGPPDPTAERTDQLLAQVDQLSEAEVDSLLGSMLTEQEMK
jgi:acyl transferase domain-containing protein/acyl carrier protein